METVERPEKARRLELVEKPAKTRRPEDVERLNSERMRICLKTDPSDSGGVKRNGKAPRWYRAHHPDRVLPKEAVVP